MAGVDHAYQYSVEVGSRFSLFLDDSVNNEDPDLLLMKLKSRKAEKSKKDKPQLNVQPSKISGIDDSARVESKTEALVSNGNHYYTLDYFSFTSC